jgi:hypothetical protein
MALRSNHYDVAFEAYLRHLRTPYVAVDEARRALTADASLKSFDFIVYSPAGPNLLVDVKGRRFPTALESGGHCWENWATDDDVRSLLHWQRVFGAGFRSLFVFAYDIVEPRYRGRHTHAWDFHGRTYALYGVWVDDYLQTMRTRSPRWETVSLPLRDFARLRRPFDELVRLPLPAAV